jgi:tetratricopeptide (TPR) repeat protein
MRNFIVGCCIGLLSSCSEENKTPPVETINTMNLKRGDLVSCGPADKKYGDVAFNATCSENVKQDFNLAVSLLHSFEYDDAEKVFARIIDKDPGCAMAYWGVAMSNYHPLWAPPTQSELEKGAKAVHIAQLLPEKSKQETAYINAIALFYKDWNKIGHPIRSAAYENAMQKIYMQYTADKEAAIFYALALNASADPTDKTYAKQKKAAEILNRLYPGQPFHPGIIHYIIHSYDYPELAALALPAARKYASIAPSSAHAQHMPSHIFTRLGLWDEDIQSNLASMSSAKCYAESTGIKGHWDEELHGLDYAVYAYLQKGDNANAKKQWDYLKSIKQVQPVNFKVAYAFAAVPSRFVLENRMWQQAANISMDSANFSWKEYPWQKAILHFTRALGAAHTGKPDVAANELKALNLKHDELVKQKNLYQASQVEIQSKTAEAWILFKKGSNKKALQLMEEAADMEDRTQKHPVTPGEVLPARELLGDMLLEMNKPVEALIAYEKSLTNHPNRFNGLFGAATAAETAGNSEKAHKYYQQLLHISGSINSDRPELEHATSYLGKRGARTIAAR